MKFDFNHGVLLFVKSKSVMAKLIKRWHQSSSTIAKIEFSNVLSQSFYTATA